MQLKVYKCITRSFLDTPGCLGAISDITADERRHVSASEEERASCVLTYPFPVWRDLQSHQSTLIKGVQSPANTQMCRKVVSPNAFHFPELCRRGMTKNGEGFHSFWPKGR